MSAFGRRKLSYSLVVIGTIRAMERTSARPQVKLRSPPVFNLILPSTVKNFYEIPGFILTKLSRDCVFFMSRRDFYRIIVPM
jgi:hypothetical protein